MSKHDDLVRLFGVRQLGAALLSIAFDQGQSGAKPPHSKEAPELNVPDIYLRANLF